MKTQQPRQPTHKNHTHKHSFAHKTTHTNARTGKKRKRGQVDTGEPQPPCVTLDTPLPWWRGREKSLCGTPANVCLKYQHQLLMAAGGAKRVTGICYFYQCYSEGAGGEQGGWNYIVLEGKPAKRTERKKAIGEENSKRKHNKNACKMAFLIKRGKAGEPNPNPTHLDSRIWIPDWKRRRGKTTVSSLSPNGIKGRPWQLSARCQAKEHRCGFPLPQDMQRSGSLGQCIRCASRDPGQGQRSRAWWPQFTQDNLAYLFASRSFMVVFCLPTSKALISRPREFTWQGHCAWLWMNSMALT